jgi:hypothetical protein
LSSHFYPFFNYFMHLFVFVLNLQHNAGLRVLAIKSTDEKPLLAAAGESLVVLANNSSIQELRFFGAALSAPVLKGLLQGVQEGFTGLRILEFTVDVSSGIGAVGAQTRAHAKSNNNNGNNNDDADHGRNDSYRKSDREGERGTGGIRGLIQYSSAKKLESSSATPSSSSSSRKGGASIKVGVDMSSGNGTESSSSSGSIGRSTSDWAELVVAAAQNRAYMGRNGLSVTVNYR